MTILPTFSNNGIVFDWINEACLLFLEAHSIKIINDLNNANPQIITMIVFNIPTNEKIIFSGRSNNFIATLRPKNKIE